MEAAGNPAFGEGNPEDIFLSPHSDDACFSIGHLASTRRAGTLVTVFAVSGYSAAGAARGADNVRQTTRTRMREDAAFAHACGLRPRWMRHVDAQTRGLSPFDTGHVPAVAAEIGAALHRTLMAPTIGRLPEPRPWLFCPAGIGGHVDHLAVTASVIARLDVLRQHYRIAFYEDLHYASRAQQREAGLAALRQSLAGHEVSRHTIALETGAQASKMQLVALYASQLSPALGSIAAFTPAAAPGNLPHEALWVLQDERHQAAG